MYDCFWYEAFAYSPRSYGQCEHCRYKIHPGQNEIVDKFYDEKEDDVNKALELVNDKWVARFELYKHMFDNHEL